MNNFIKRLINIAIWYIIPTRRIIIKINTYQVREWAKVIILGSVCAYLVFQVIEQETLLLLGGL